MSVAPKSEDVRPIAASGFLVVDGARLEYRLWSGAAKNAAILVLLHEGLGSVGLWGDFPGRLAATTGRRVFAYSRAGYGASSAIALPRPLDYMQREAIEVLPRVLDAIGFAQGALIGHSDGASIAAVYAGAHRDARVAALTLIAPHFVVEDMTIAAIERARQVYESGDLKPKLARWHADADITFRGWNEAWLDPGFRDFDISSYLRDVAPPVQIIQGKDDPYGSVRQIEIARARLPRPPDVTMLPSVGHAPHREAMEATLRQIRLFLAPLGLG
ncbi:MAG TPA: alpha/beta hydrolase [Roseiarcus sp.]|nr:alpha/beta hydrolase [Roseiarcus sp.]